MAFFESGDLALLLWLNRIRCLGRILFGVLFVKLSFGEGFEEIASCVLEDARLDYHYSFYVCFYYFHFFIGLSSCKLSALSAMILD